MNTQDNERTPGNLAQSEQGGNGRDELNSNENKLGNRSSLPRA